MSNLVAVAVAVVLAAILWRIIRWMTRQSNVVRTEVELPTDKHTPKLACGKTRETPPPSTTGECILKKTDDLQRSPVSELSHRRAFEADVLQLELGQERRLRERAEDWAEFLTRELEAHIRARIEAERRCRRLERKMNSVSPTVLTANETKPVSRTFKDIGEAHETWQKTSVTQNKQQELTYNPDHDENEWHQVVDANNRFLQTVNANKQRGDRTNASCKTTEHCLRRNESGSSTDSNKTDLKTDKINITVEACTSPGVEQKMLQRTIKDNDNSSYDDFTKLRLPTQDQQKFEEERMKVLKGTYNSNRETNQSDETERDKNPLVCTESLSNIKKTTEIWESLRVSKETISSRDDLSPTSADIVDDITPGLVQKNLKKYETSETVENMENQ